MRFESGVMSASRSEPRRYYTSPSPPPAANTASLRLENPEAALGCLPVVTRQHEAGRAPGLVALAAEGTCPDRLLNPDFELTEPLEQVRDERFERRELLCIVG